MAHRAASVFAAAILLTAPLHAGVTRTEGALTPQVGQGA